MDYGTVSLRIHYGLSYDQKMSMILSAFENQLFAPRNHYNEIVDSCLAFTKLVEDGTPIKIKSNKLTYKYTFILDYLKVVQC